MRYTSSVPARAAAPTTPRRLSARAILWSCLTNPTATSPHSPTWAGPSASRSCSGRSRKTASSPVACPGSTASSRSLPPSPARCGPSPPSTWSRRAVWAAGPSSATGSPSRIPSGHDLAIIEAILPRATAFARKDPAETTVEQVLIANVDVVFVVQSLSGRGLNVRRLERELVLAWESGATPIVILTKADVAEDVEYQRNLASDVRPQRRGHR